MSINRPNNINKRLAGTANCTPGNAGQIGPVKTPYCVTYNPTPTLGERYCGGGGSCAGIFKLTESNCGRTDRCDVVPKDYGGNVICKGGGSVWIVAPSAAEVVRNWWARNDANTSAQSLTGCSGWFVPSCGQLQNPVQVCRDYWDFPNPPTGSYWSNTEFNAQAAWYVNMSAGSAGCFFTPTAAGKSVGRLVRSFRTSAY
jgi:hypothetical protein